MNEQERQAKLSELHKDMQKPTNLELLDQLQEQRHELENKLTDARAENGAMHTALTSCMVTIGESMGLNAGDLIRFISDPANLRNKRKK